ncbi:MAG: CorA family divalent cation transporter, partial [Acidobacteriota bacterium]
MIRYFVHRDGRTSPIEAIDPAWLRPDSGVYVWADVSEPKDADGVVLHDVFGIHELAVEDALSETPHPKVEAYGEVLYVVLHGINFHASEHAFDTHDTDFFVTTQFLITVHDGQRRSIAHIAELCGKSAHILAEGPVALMHRIVDTMVDHYHPEVNELEEWLDDLERQVLETPKD